MLDQRRDQSPAARGVLGPTYSRATLSFTSKLVPRLPDIVYLLQPPPVQTYLRECIPRWSRSLYSRCGEHYQGDHVSECSITRAQDMHIESQA